MDAPPSGGSSAAPPPPPVPPVPPFGTPRPRQLRRRPDEGHIAGVCAGVAEYFNVDPIIVRIAAVVLAVTGPGVIAYVLAWIFVPAAEGPATPFTSEHGDRRDRGAQIFGILLLAIAVSVLWGDWWSPARRWMFPLGLMALGTWLLLRRDRPEGEGSPGGTPGTTGWVPPAPWRPPATPDATAVGEETAGADLDRTLETAAGAESVTGGGPPTAPWGYGPPPGTPGHNGVARRRRGMLGPIVMGALLVWSGIAWLAGISVEHGLAVGLCIVGIGFVLGAFVGGSWGLVVPAIAIGGALVVATVADIPLSGPIGDRTWTPRTPAELEGRYELSIGEGTLDLTEVPIGANGTLTIDASVGIGHLVVEVPDDVAVEVSADISAGEAVLLGVHDAGMGVSSHRSFDGLRGAGTIELDLQVGFGQIEVRRSGDGPRTTTSTTTLQ